MVTNPVDMLQDEHDDTSGAKRILMYGTKTDSTTTPILLNDDGTVKFEEVLAHVDLSDMPDTGGTNTDHDERYLQIVIGTIASYGGAYDDIPTGWLLCDGSAISQTTYADLFAVIGVLFGDPGGGNFNLPDLRAKFTRGAADSQSGGATGGATCHLHNNPIQNTNVDCSQCFKFKIKNKYCIASPYCYVARAISCPHVKGHRHCIAAWNTSECSNIPPYQNVVWIIKT